MTRSLIVARHEIGQALRRRSFWVMTLIFPLLILGMSLGNSLVAEMGADSLDELLADAPYAPDAQLLGYVDQSGLLNELPPDVPPELVPRFASEDQARSAVEAGRIAGYYLLPAGYPASGEVVVVREELQPLSADQGADPLLRYLTDYALTKDAAVAAALVDPAGDVQVEVVGEAAGGAGSEGAVGEAAGAPAGEGADEVPEGIVELAPFAVLFVLFFVITTSSSYLLQSVTAEKENRTAEVLLVALPPRQLMMGKILGLGVVALLQISIWVAAGLLVMRGYLRVPDLGSVGLSVGLFGWLAVFLLLAHLAYGAILAALGALVPSQREGTQFMFLVLLPLMVPLWFNYTLTTDPHGSLSVALSLFPLSAPVAMVTRLTAGGVPWWQPLLAAGGLALTGYLFVVLAARIFRADRLLSLESLGWGTLRRAARAARH